MRSSFCIAILLWLGLGWYTPLVVASADKSSVWVFLLLGSEAVRTFKSHPYFKYVSSGMVDNCPLISLALGRSRFPLGRRLYSRAYSCRSSCHIRVSWATSVLSPSVTCVSPPALTIYIPTDHPVGLGYLKVFVPPEKVLRWGEGKLNLLGRLPHYVSVDQKTFGRYGVLPTANAGDRGTPMDYLGTTQRLGP